jgi:hypothetical protein
MAAMILSYFVIRYPLVEVLLRPRVQPPVQQALSPAAFLKQDVLTSDGRWILDSGIQDASGNHLSSDQVNQLARQAFDAGVSPAIWFQQHGYLRWMIYQPADRYWTFQGIETAIFLAMALLLIAATMRLLRRLS